MSNVNFNYTNLTPFKWYVLENFPFIEADFDALTNWQLFCKLGKEMNKIIDSVNVSGEQVEKLTNAFNELQEYVNNYFNNLDVQDEINNKLDEMVQSGELENLLSNYANTFKIYNTTIDMINDTTIVKNQKIKSLGYYNSFDGGSGDFVISDVVDNSKIQIQLSNGLYANLLIKNNTLNFKSIGARGFDNDNNKIDNKPFMTIYLNYLQNNINNSIKLFIPAGVYCFSETNLNVDNINIEGINNFQLYNMGGTVIAPINNNQNYIWKIGIESAINKRLNNLTLNNLYFTGYNITYNGTNYITNIEDIYNVSSLLMLTQVFGGFIDNLIFMFFKGQALDINSSYEIYYKLLNFRHGQNLNGAILNFSNAVNNLNITASNFEKIMFEAMHGNLINVESGANFANNRIGTINFEDYAYTYGNQDGVYFYLNREESNYNDETATHQSIINLEEKAQFECEINNIDLNNFSYKYFLYNNSQYIYDTIVNMTYNIYVNLIINNVNIAGIAKNARALKQTGEFTAKQVSIIYNNLMTDNLNYNCYFDIEGFSKLVVNNNIIKSNELTTKNNYYYFKDFINGNFPVIGNKTRGILKYDENALADNNLVLNLINPVEYPTTNRLITSIPLLGKKLHLRAKLPQQTGEISLGTDIYKRDTNEKIGNANINSQGNGNFEWYTIDYSNSISGNEIGNLYITLYPNDGYDFNIELDCFFFTD